MANNLHMLQNIIRPELNLKSESDPTMSAALNHTNASDASAVQDDDPVPFTFALIKSGAIARRHCGKILARIRQEGFVVRAAEFLYPDSRHTRLFEALYVEHLGRPYYPDLIASVDAGAYALLLVGNDAVTRWRTLMGPTNPEIARQTTPTSLRACFGGTVISDNAVHGSDSEEAARREERIFDLWFPHSA